VSKKRNVVRAGAVALTSAGVLVVGGGTAWGAASSTPASLSEIQAKAAAAITLRVNDLNSAIAKVQANANLGSEQSVLASYLQADIAPLQALGQKIAADTTATAAQADAATIFSNFRVLALVLPATWLAGDSTVILNKAVPDLTTALNKAKGDVNPENQGTLDPLIADLTNQIGTATSAATGIASTVLSYAPSAWNSNHNVLEPSHTSQQTAQNAIKAGRTDVREIWSYLKSDRGTTSTATTPASST
jgi:hypothetical protein